MNYSVRSGDTLSHLSQRFGVSVNRLARANDIANPNVIQTGESLKVPGGAGTTGTPAPADSYQTGQARGAQFAQQYNPSAVNGASDAQPVSAPAEGSGAAAVDKAKSMMGTPYNYPWDRSFSGGGVDPNGLGLRGADGSIDCSQLTSLAHGGKLPADSVAQGEMGPKLPWQSAEAGDIIAFDENGTGSASHVGIADGQGNVIHASGFTGDVTVTPISSIPSASTWAVKPNV
ncbi:MAG TPA: LysM peptidoglycan-binding domain-containing protein [Myxococcaceae bacterium]|nr:LysM peptidoglycan-binding domain-containing protein [Myxococcaceae bacterium]